MTGCEARSTSLLVRRNLFWQLSRDGSLHDSGMSHDTAASPRPSFRAPWKEADAAVSRGNTGWTTSKSGHPRPCKNCSWRPPVEKIGRGSLLNRPSCPHEDPIGQGTELNCARHVVCVCVCVHGELYDNTFGRTEGSPWFLPNYRFQWTWEREHHVFNRERRY